MSARAARLRSLAGVAIGIAVLLGSPPAGAQILPVGDSRDEYFRVLQISGHDTGESGFIRPLAFSRTLATIPDSLEHPWRGALAPPRTMELGGGITLTPVDPGVRLFLNTDRPYGPNESGVWAGSGATAAVDGGATLAWGPVTVAFHPTITFAGNAGYDLAPAERAGALDWGYPWRRVDLPQRFGTDPVWNFLPGQSSVRVRLGDAAAIGFGTESLWWGPGIRNAIVMSNHAPGFPRAFLETARPLDVWIGNLEAQWTFGRLHLSESFDTTYVDPGRYFTGAVISLTPRGLDGLHLGASRSYVAEVPEGGIGAEEFFLVFESIRKMAFYDEAPGGNDERDQLASFFLRWVIPEGGFEVWTEWARNDHGRDFRDYFLLPEHASGATYGLRKTLPLSGNRLLALEAELTNLQRPATNALRATPVFYAHHLVLPGYTHDGRVLGAWVGPGGSSQYLGAKLYAPWGRASLLAQRRVVDNDAYYAMWEGETFAECCVNALLDLGGEVLRRFGSIEASASGMMTREFNRDFVFFDDRWAASFRFEARWRPR